MGVVVPTLTALLCTATLLVFVSPFPLLPVVLLVGWAIALVGLVWIVFAAVQLLRYRWDRRSLLAPAIVVLTAGLLVFHVPFRLGWLAMEGTMTSRAQECSTTHERHWIGLYSVESVSGSPAGCHFQLTGGFLNTVGIAYLPGGAPRIGYTDQEGVRGYEPIDGDWYRYRVAF